MQTLRETTIQRIREIRLARGMTQQQLAERLSVLGSPTHQTSVARVESGKRELTLYEAFQYAYALDVAPVHLFVPTDSDELISIGPNMEAPPDHVREWIRGNWPFGDPRLYRSQVPLNEAYQAPERDES
jgi:transcriptional regulator with XRE-family HTH domain